MNPSTLIKQPLSWLSTAFLLLIALITGSLSVAAQTRGQASITLNNCNMEPCHTQNHEWTLTKSLTSNDGQKVTWTVTATKDPNGVGPQIITVNGVITVTNTGSANATIGNIVVNLQKQNSPKKGSNASHVSVAANVADATMGDAATSANIVATASQENAATNAAWGTNNYTTSGARGTFAETGGSGSLEFTDANSNTIFSLTPQVSLTPGQSITLLYTAKFNNSVLNIPAGTSLRAEALVTFGNSGGRGGSGSSATNIDINGNGVLDADEANVRTVACRVTRALPVLEPCNDSVTLTDTETNIAATGTVTFSNFTTDIGGGTGTETLTASATRYVSVDYVGGELGGLLTNCADLDGESSSVSVQGPQIGTDPVTFLPIYQYYEFSCCVGVDLEACDSVLIGPTGGGGGGPMDGDYCTYSQGGFGGPGAPFNLLNSNFATVFPSGIEVGIPGTGGFSLKFTSAAAVQNYLPANKTPDKLTADLTNPTSTSAGVFGGQVLTLKINVALSAAGATSNTLGNFGNLYYCNPGDSLHGMTVSQILAAMETALGGGALPAGHTYASLSDLADSLNTQAYHECKVGGFATKLSRTPCP